MIGPRWCCNPHEQLGVHREEKACNKGSSGNCSADERRTGTACPSLFFLSPNEPVLLILSLNRLVAVCLQPVMAWFPTDNMEDSSFEDVYQQIAWELCVEAAAKAKTDLTFSVFTDRTAPQKTVSVQSLDDASSKLAASRNGGVKVRGSWMAGGRQGNIEFVCDEQFSPTVTATYISRFIEDRIRLEITRRLFHRGSPTIDFVQRNSK